ncbi:MAG: 2Fe-2S iron-sulfur cluster-binding protein, partial [Desulfomonilaceae bacterium]
MTDKIKVRFLPDDIMIEATLGDSLLDAALNAGVFIPAACGGSGACGQCKVKIVQGQVKAESTEKIRPEDRNQGYVLACQSKLIQDVTIEVPMAKVGRKVIPRDEADRMKTMARPMESPITPELNPMTISVLMRPSTPSLQDNISDYERIVRELKVNHNISPVVASLDVLKTIPTHVREYDWQFTALLKPEHLPGLDTYYRLLNIRSGHKPPTRTAMAVDIGTTSLWGELINIETGEVLARASRYNPQISMGDDVISRIVFALKKEGSEKLQQGVVQGLNEIINEALEKSGTDRSSINYMVAAGNTVMTHLFLGLYPRFLRQTPYVPVAQNIGSVRARELGLDMPEGTFVNVFPGVASYVGGDIVSGVLANGMWDSDLMTLFIDIGTNGEIVAG